VWSAIIGAAIVITKENKNFEFNNITDKRFLFFLFSSVVLHGIWDTFFSLFGSFSFKFIVLTIIIWLFVFILLFTDLIILFILYISNNICNENINNCTN